MREIGYFYKEDEFLMNHPLLTKIILGFFTIFVCGFEGLTICIYIDNLNWIAFLIMIFTCTLFTYLLIYMYKTEYVKKRAKDVILLYDEERKVFVINGIKNTIEINLNDIVNIKYKNKQLDLLDLGIIGIPLFVSQPYGKIEFKTSNGKKIKTIEMKDIKKVYQDVDAIIKNEKAETESKRDTFFE